MDENSKTDNKRDIDENDSRNLSNIHDVENESLEKLPYPKSVFFIVSNEFCERFSYYGMRTILSLYLTDILLYQESDAKIIYHAFTMFVYFFPIFGAILSDSLLGKFRTILYVSIIYACGNIVLALAATPPLHFPTREISMLGLLLIALGTGGIKPCVSAFGGDQFKLPQQELQLATFFSLFYFSINAGSLLSTLLTPILREDVKCFDMDSCYSLAFAVPGILMIVSIVIFAFGKPMYKIRTPEGNMIVKVSKCIGNAIATKIKSKGVKKDHWLDYAEETYGAKQINDIKALLKVLVLFIPLPVFWALFDQQGSGWTFMARRMNGDMGLFTILPDQMQVVNPLLILMFIPLFQYAIYPLLSKCHVLKTPLQRLVAGGCLAAVSFVVSAILSLTLESTFPILPSEGNGQLRIYNALPCELQIKIENSIINIPSLNSYKQIDIPVENEKLLSYSSQECYSNSGTFKIVEGKAVAYLINEKTELPVRIEDNVDKNSRGYPMLRYLTSGITDNITLYTAKNNKINELLPNNNSLFDLTPDEYVIKIGNWKSEVFKLQLGGVYAYVVTSDGSKYNDKLITVTEPNSVNIFLLMPQYIIITMGEIMFSITGLEFAYSQAPTSMKSVLQACWLLTTAFGNLIVVIIESIEPFEDQSKSFFLYAGLMLIDMAVFSLMAMRYKYVKSENSEEGINLHESKTKGVDNGAFKNNDDM